MKILLALLFLLPQDSPAPAPEPFRVAPYLQNVTRTRITICWRTAREANGTVHYGRTGKMKSTAEGPRGTKHEVRLRNLSPGTLYHYKVGAWKGRFRTAPGERDSFTFVLYGDGRTGHKTHGKLVRLMAKANPDLAVHSGDLVENGRILSQWKNFFEISDPLFRNVPFYPALGNHERNSPYYFDFFALPGKERSYSFDYGPAHFVVLDSNGKGKSDSDFLSWLKKDLASTKKPFIFAIYHHPALSSTFTEARRQSAAQMYTLWGKIFEKGRVSFALQGHNHNYQRSEKNGIVYITSGGAGAPLYPLGKALPETKARKIAHHFVQFHVSNSKVTAEVVGIDGKVIDRFVRKAEE